MPDIRTPYRRKAIGVAVLNTVAEVIVEAAEEKDINIIVKLSSL